ncbi:hypothetical protein BJX76DRAFT_320503 [Aspergillus varians]
MDLPQTTELINNILSQVSHYTTPTTPSAAENEPRSQTQRYPRMIQPPSAFPNSQLTNLKPLMLTLHCIFPNEFLLALDILDRRLIRRVRTRHKTASGDRDEDGNQDTDEPAAETQIDVEDEVKENKGPEEDFFFVTSASTIPSTSRSLFPASQLGGDQRQLQKQKQWQEKGYEVRLQAWNCTCPSFTLSAFRNLGPGPLSPPSSSCSSSPLSSSPGKTENAEVDDEHPSDHADNADANADADATDTAAYSFGGTLPLHRESAPVCKHILACLLAALCPGLGGGEGEAEVGQFVTLDLEEIAALCAGWGG